MTSKMSNDEIINQAFLELKNHSKVYLMFKELTLLEGYDRKDDNFQKIRYLLIKSKVFDKHTEHAIKFSELGIEISTDFIDWYDYKKSLKKKPDYVKWIGLLVSILLLTWNIYQGVKNNKLEKENINLKNKIENLKNTGANTIYSK